MTPRIINFRIPYLSLNTMGKPVTIISAMVSTEGTGGERPVAIELIGMSHKRANHTCTLSGALPDMAILARELIAVIPTVAIHGSNEYCMATELPSGDLLVCATDVGVTAIEDYGDASFVMDAFSLPGVEFIPYENIPVTHESGPAIGLNYGVGKLVQKRNARLWIYKGDNKHPLAETLVRNRWVVFEGVGI